MNLQEVELLLIEDNPHEAELAIMNLKANKLANNLVHIDDGEEALDFIFSRGKFSENFGRFNPKVILLDLKLPKVDGHEILRQIRSNEATRKIPVVVLTSSNQNPDIELSYKLGANSYIVKPLNFETFSKAIKDLGLYWMVLNVPNP